MAPLTGRKAHSSVTESPQKARPIVSGLAFGSVSSMRSAMGEMPEAVADRALEYYRAQPIPERRPAAGDVRVDPLGYVWMARYRGLPGRTPVSAWEIFDAEGRWLGSLETPAWKRILEIGEDYVFAVVADELDVEHPTLFPLQRIPSG